MNKANLIITGALGHLGSYLINEYDFKSFNKVILIDNFATQRYASLFNLKSNKFTFFGARY